MARESVKFISVDLLPYIGQATPLASIFEVCFPVDENCVADLLSVTFNPGSTAVADAGGVTLALDRINSAAAATTLALLAATSIVAGTIAADVPTVLVRGRTQFSAGQHIKGTFATDGALTTPAVGASLLFEFEISERSGI